MTQDLNSYSLPKTVQERIDKLVEQHSRLDAKIDDLVDQVDNLQDRLESFKAARDLLNRPPTQDVFFLD